ncbi:putative toxin-antitoxin system toxin component, PIN family [Oxalobacter sp. OttesenSCG-928-P03]|nr:putative toxin-antitoxin system toxin component, PIN family [Oxalobacter sp. OttesenSCG-928-P03]
MSACHIILDTNVCLDLFVFRDPRCMELMQMLKNRTVSALTRNDCRDEWLRVLTYPSLSLDNTIREKCIAKYDEMIFCADIEKKDYALLPLCHDQDDQKFLELTYDAKAGFLITKDKALLKLSGKTRKRHLFQIIKPEQSNLILRAIKQKET